MLASIDNEINKSKTKTNSSSTLKYLRSLIKINKNSKTLANGSNAYACSSTSSSPLVLFSSALKSCTTGAISNSSNDNNFMQKSNTCLNDEISPTNNLNHNGNYYATAPVNGNNNNNNISSFSYYSTTFTNSIKSKLNQLKNNLIVYKGSYLNSKFVFQILLCVVFLFCCLLNVRISLNRLLWVIAILI